MRPDLFKATVAGVPFVDVVTTMLGPTIPLIIAEWEEWGDPRKEEFYFYMKSYSPVDNGYHRLMQNLHRVQQVFANIMNRDITWPKIPEEMSYEAYDLINKLLTENPAQRLGAIGAVEMDHFFKNIHWDTLTRQKVDGGSDFDDMSDTGSTFGDNSFGNMLEEEVNALLSYLEIDNHEGLVREHMPDRYAELDQYWGESQLMGLGPRADGWADEFSQEHGGDPNAWALSLSNNMEQTQMMSMVRMAGLQPSQTMIGHLLEMEILDAMLKRVDPLNPVLQAYLKTFDSSIPTRILLPREEKRTKKLKKAEPTSPEKKAKGSTPSKSPKKKPKNVVVIVEATQVITPIAEESQENMMYEGLIPQISQISMFENENFEGVMKMLKELKEIS
ncbi:unnamed protein product [Lactuca saligna]|uniref:Prolyl endopeptidase-like n=1 Tax=Lactuca saligna TaxID=75948 RepID=A0AA35Z003_LACSI|nr:unnamed protein product [Lactuca saligna]